MPNLHFDNGYLYFKNYDYSNDEMLRIIFPIYNRKIDVSNYINVFIYGFQLLSQAFGDEWFLKYYNQIIRKVAI